MYEADKDQLVQLQERFAMLEKQYDAIIEERRVAEEEKARKMEEERKQNQAAEVIQTVWRSYQFRKLMRGKSKKSTKKGKGGKGFELTNLSEPRPLFNFYLDLLWIVIHLVKFPIM